jgi:hypothetical protein
LTVFIFANDAASTLAAPITNTALALTVASGDGAEFNNPSAGQQFVATINDAATGLLTEVTYCTARSGDTFTAILRGQEGTVAQNWLAGDLVANLNTAGTMAAMQQTAALSPARTVVASGVFAMSTADAGGHVGLKRITSVATSSTTLPASADGDTYWIDDLAKNFNAFPVTVNFPGGTTGPDGATDQLLNVNGQSAQFTFFGDSNTWSFKP